MGGKGDYIFLTLVISGMTYALALAVLSNLAGKRGPEFLVKCRRWLVGVMALVTVAFLTSLTVFGNTRMSVAGYVAGGSNLSLLGLILVAVAFSRIERRAQSEAGEDG